MNTIVAISGTKIRNENGLYSLNDLHKASGALDKHAPRRWLQNKQTHDLIEQLEIDGIPSIQSKQGLGTFVCMELVIHYGMWISPEFSLKVIRTFLDFEQANCKRLSNDYHLINKEQTLQIQLAVEQRSQRTGESYQKIYAGLHAYLRIDSYKTMPVEHYTAALKYLESTPDAPVLFKSAVTDRQVLPNINKDGRWLVIVRNNIVTHVKNISGYNCVNMEAFDKLMMQTKQQAEYLLELAKRMRVAEGMCDHSRLDVPIEELHPKFII
ncbi:KilA-N domain-containing protein [Snodgrassella alvi]|uniref:KilA-N domain-containing protein n=1 Tax=Snodgrassella alvi TaxID=1196083 RepID=UPI000C1E980B|nr:KilA-N domain-containing protein [Snodgrassella alvi]